MQVIAYNICMICNSIAPVIKEPKYDGLRGMCPKCENNWPES